MEQHSPPLEITAPAEPQKLLPDGHPPSPPRRKHRLWIWFLLLVLLAAGGYYYWSKGKPAASSGSGKSGGKQGQGANAAAPVDAAKAHGGNIGVYVTGLGAVTPIYTVTVQSRVTGELMKVQFKEGQIVQKGDLLVEIDPRPYEVQLEQAQGQLIHDEALLKDAKLDLDRYNTLIKQDAKLVASWENVWKELPENVRLTLTPAAGDES